jgi:hypothetical protein
VGKREASEYPTSDTKCGIVHSCFHEFFIYLREFSIKSKKIVCLVVVFSKLSDSLKRLQNLGLGNSETSQMIDSRIHEFSVCNLQVGKRKASEYPTSDTKCGVAHP